MPSFKGQLTDQQIADVAAYVVKSTGGTPAHTRAPGRPSRRSVAAFAVDLDRTLIAEGRGAPAAHARGDRARRAPRGMHVIVVTGRMFRAVRPYLEEAGLDDPVVCYQGAVVADPRRGEFLRHVPIPRAGRARGDRRRRRRRLPRQLLRRRQLYVAEVTPEARVVRRLPGARDPRGRRRCTSGCTTIRRSSSPSATRDALDALEDELKPRFAGRLFVSKSLPHFLEFAHPGREQGLGAPVRRRPARLHRRRRPSRAATARTTASSSTGPASASPSRTRTRRSSRRADLVVPDVEHEGVAALLDAYLDSRRMIDLRAARHDPDALPRRARAQGRGRAVRRAARRRPRGARACSRASRSCARKRKLKGKPTPEQLAELEQVKAELQQLEAAARGGGGAAQAICSTACRTRRPRTRPTASPTRTRSRSGASASRRRSTSRSRITSTSRRRSAGSTWSARRRSPARASRTAIGDLALLELALYRYALDRLVQKGFTVPCCRRCSCARRRCTAPASCRPTR